MVRRFRSLAYVAVFGAATVITAPTEAATSSGGNLANRCQLVLISAGGGSFDTCNYSATSLNGFAVYSVAQGSARLIVDCTIGNLDLGGLRSAGTRSYTQVGTCSAALIAEGNGETAPVTALANVGSTGI